jgi:hypothetical protein
MWAKKNLQEIVWRMRTGLNWLTIDVVNAVMSLSISIEREKFLD